MAAKTPAPLSLAAQIRTLVPAVAAYEAERAETVREKRARGTGRPRDIDVGQRTRERIVEIIRKCGQARVHEIAESIAMTPGRVSHHLTILLTENKLRRVGTSQQGYTLKRGSHA